MKDANSIILIRVDTQLIIIVNILFLIRCSTHTVAHSHTHTHTHAHVHTHSAYPQSTVRSLIQGNLQSDISSITISPRCERMCVWIMRMCLMCFLPSWAGWVHSHCIHASDKITISESDKSLCHNCNRYRRWSVLNGFDCCLFGISYSDQIDSNSWCVCARVCMWWDDNSKRQQKPLQWR